MEKEKLPIKFFAPRAIDELRVEPGGNSELPAWLLSGEDLKQHSSELCKLFNEYTEKLKNRTKRNSAIPFVFLAKIFDGSTAKSKRKDISAFFQTSEKNNVIGLMDSDELIVKLSSVSEMGEISTRLCDYTNNSYALSCLETFFEFKPFFKVQEDECSYKVKLIDYQDYEVNLAIQRIFEQALTANCLDYKKIYYARELPIYKIINISPTTIDNLKKEDFYEMLFSFEPMPKYFVSLDYIQDQVVVDLEKPKDGLRYETLGILDSGIASLPHLDPWFSDKRWSVYPESAINATHGTFVAGVASYGDVCEKKEWVGHHGIKLFDAAVFPDTSKEGLDEDELIANIQEAIVANHEKVKVWNLSISITRPVRDDKFSDFAVALDDLQDRFNILICKSAGNCNNFLCNLPKGRIHEGADSVRSLVVGSVVHEKGPYDISEIDNCELLEFCPLK